VRRFLFRTAAAMAALLGGVSLAGADGPRERDVLEAVFRQQIQEHLDASERARGTVVCVGVDAGVGGATAATDLVARLASDKAVRRLAECERRAEGAVEVATSKAAFMVTAGPIEWVAADEAWVTVNYYRTKLLSAKRRYRVVHDRSGWVSLGPIMKDGPA